MTGRIFAEYECEGRVLTVEIVDCDIRGGADDCVTIVSDKFPRVFVRHQGWCKQHSMTVPRWAVNHVRMVTSLGDIIYPKKKGTRRL